MQTIKSAAQLLARARSAADLAPLIAAAGCTGEPAPLDSDTRRALGLGAEVVEARVAAGAGALRALMLELRDEHSMRDLLPALAARLATRAPHVLWLVAATQVGRQEVALAAWRDDRRPPRIAALLANRCHLVDSDAQTVAALCCPRREDDLLTHARWVDVLGREALTRRFYLGLESAIAQLASSSGAGTEDQRAELALLHTSRLLFLSFVEGKGWLNGERDFLRARFDECILASGGFHRRLLLPLFFGTLNTPFRRRASAARLLGRIPFLNGGLFARTPVERRAGKVMFSDAAHGALLYDLFGHYRFTAREESSEWSEVAVDPEMLGRALETLMAARERKGSGAYFTPHDLVARATDAALDELRGRCDDLPALASVALLDPACGSGAFLVYALEQLSALRRSLGDERPMADIRRQVLTTNIFGVDINPMAVWLCELRLWLSVVVESEENDPAKVVPLPNLDHNVLVGDALTGPDFRQVHALERDSRALREIRRRYAHATGARKEGLRRRLIALERAYSLATIDSELATIKEHRRDLLTSARGRDLFGGRSPVSLADRENALALRRRASALRAARRRVLDGGALPFSFPARFADIAARGGFDMVVGNPPWVRVHHLSAASRETFRRDFETARLAAWQAGAELAGAGRGFASQLDVAALFVERSLNLLQPGATLSLLLPAKLWRSLAGGGVRRLVLRDAEIRALHDLSEAPTAFDAAVYPSLLVARRRAAVIESNEETVVVRLHVRGRGEIGWTTTSRQIGFDDSPGAPWLTIPPDVHRAFDRLRELGPPLTTVVGRPLLGVKCGCNEAFVLEVLGRRGDLATVRSAHGHTGTVESLLVRPVLRGESLTPWRIEHAGESILWTHDAAGAPLEHLPPLAKQWLRRWRSELVGRSDARRTQRWWSLFRIEGARDDRPRVVWGDVGRAPRASVLHAGGSVAPLNSCYVVRCRGDAEAYALSALLNGPLAQAWVNALAEPARGGYHRYLGWTMGLLPLPPRWEAACDLLSPLGRRGESGDPPGAQELLDVAAFAYGASRAEFAPLVAWCAHE